MKLFVKWLRLVFSKRGFQALVDNWQSYRTRHEQRIARLKTQGMILNQMENVRASARNRCNHRRGGTILRGEKVNKDFFTVGDSPRFALIKHTFPWGETWMRCMRCGKWWKPGDEDYDKMLKEPNENHASTSIQFGGVNLETVRELTANS